MIPFFVCLLIAVSMSVGWCSRGWAEAEKTARERHEADVWWEKRQRAAR